MSILSREHIGTNPQKTENRSASRRWTPRIGRWLFILFGSLAALWSLVTVAVLPFITAVPLSLFILLAAVDIALLVFLFKYATTLPLQLGGVAGLVVVLVAAVLFSQWFAMTPPIAGADGQPLPNSIAELTTVDLNGSRQWLTIRGQDQDKPILLFLAGGPGGSQLAATRKMLGELEKEFVVVNWDQRGAGKSYRAADFDALTPGQYIDDAHELTLYLRERFGQEKIYLMGESWGSLLGAWLVRDYPDLYHAYAGVAQMVAFLETDTYDYDLALKIAREQGDAGKVKALEEQGPPPYYGEGVAWPVIEYIMYLSNHMNRNPQITGPGYDTFGDIGAPEYGLYDKINYFRGLLATMNALWPQLWEVDLRQEAPVLEVPVYFLEGRHDINAPPYLVESYLETLQAPHKELIWFEHSGHSPWVDESHKVVDVLVNKVKNQ